MGSDEKPIEIRKMHFDGYEHYLRTIDHERIKKGSENLRPYFIINKDLQIDDRTCDHRKNDSQNYDDCQILQLTDLLIGSARISKGYFSNNIKTDRLQIQKEIASPITDLIEKNDKGIARMKNSRWNGSICLSDCFLENGEWKFEKLKSKQSYKQSEISW